MPHGNTLTAVTNDLEREAAVRAPGERLPSVRELMARHGAGPGTVQRALSALTARGIVDTRPGHGTFVGAAPAAAARGADLGWQTVALGPARPYAGAEALEELLRPPSPGDHVLSSGYLPPDLQPVTGLGQALGRAGRRPGAWDRVPPEGIAPLRAWFAADIGGGAEADDVLVCHGGQGALSACLRALAAPGAPVVVESPTYLGVLAVARAAGVTPVPVPTDEHGVRPEHLADALARTGARLAYLQPTFANPHGATLAAERRGQVLEAAVAAGAFLIEDDAFRHLSLGASAPAPLLHDDRDGHVVHVRSLTKVASPGLRVAALLARGPAAARLLSARVVDDYFVAGPLQEAAVELVSAPAWPRHLRRLRGELRARRDALATAVDHHLGPGRVATLPQGGLHLWVALDPHEDDVALAQRARRAGVIVSPGRPFFPAEPPAAFLRLTYAATPPERLTEAVARLAAVR